jgi:hypothetical protein
MTTTHEDDPLPDAQPAPLRSHPVPLPSRLTAAVIEPDDGPAECTLFPADADEDELVTAWMTAKEGSFVHCRSMR